MRYLLILVLIMLTATPCYAYVLRVVETHTLEYENGKIIDQRGGQFEIRYEINEEQSVVQRTDLRYIGRMKARGDEYLEDETVYTITSIDQGGNTSLSSAFLRDPRKRDQKIITAIGRPGSIATEMVVFGEDFYLYCKAANGRFYIASGTVQRAN